MEQVEQQQRQQINESQDKIQDQYQQEQDNQNQNNINNTDQKQITNISMNQSQQMQYPQQKIDILKEGYNNQEPEQNIIYSESQNKIQQQLQFQEISQQQKYKHKNAKREIQHLHDFHADNFSYCQVEYLEQPTIVNKRCTYMKQTAPLGEYGTTSISFNKERHRINPNFIKKHQAGLIDYEQEQFQQKKSQKQGVSFLLSRDQIKYGSDLPNKNPGVGKYNAVPLKSNNFQFTFGKKTPNPLYNISIMKNPGPGKYEILDDINTVGEYKIQKYKNSLCRVFTPPTSGRFQKINRIKPGPGQYKFENINGNGRYRESKLQNPPGGQWSISERFKVPNQRVQTPGPGAHKLNNNMSDSILKQNSQSQKQIKQKTINSQQNLQQKQNNNNNQIQGKKQQYFQQNPNLKLQNNKNNNTQHDKSIQQQDFSNFEMQFQNSSFFQQSQYQPIQPPSQKNSKNQQKLQSPKYFSKEMGNQDQIQLEKSNKSVKFKEMQKQKQHNLQQKNNLAAISKTLNNNFV